MLYAYDKNKNKIRPSKGIVGFCGECGDELIAKCGNINIWHWSHKNNSECTYDNDMCEWHINWQNKYPPENQEVIINNNNIRKIADVKINGIVIEFQHSPISVDEINCRENHYGDMLWVFDFTNSYYKYDEYYTKGKWGIGKLNVMKKTVWISTKPVILEAKNGISFLLIDKFQKLAIKFETSNIDIMVEKFIKNFNDTLNNMHVDKFKNLNNTHLKLTFGKYKDENIYRLLKDDIMYCRWLYNNSICLKINNSYKSFVGINNIENEILKTIQQELKLNPKTITENGTILFYGDEFIVSCDDNGYLNGHSIKYGAFINFS